MTINDDIHDGQWKNIFNHLPSWDGHTTKSSHVFIFFLTSLDWLDLFFYMATQLPKNSSGRYLTLLLLLVAAPGRNVAWKGCRSGCEKGLGEPSNDGALQQCPLPDLEHRIGVPCPDTGWDGQKCGRPRYSHVQPIRPKQIITTFSQIYMSSVSFTEMDGLNSC